jgi:chloramphenicol 3-O-phosphotransferase
MVGCGVEVHGEPAVIAAYDIAVRAAGDRRIRARVTLLAGVRVDESVAAGALARRGDRRSLEVGQARQRHPDGTYEDKKHSGEP